MEITIYLTVDPNNRVTGWADQRGSVSDVEITVDDTHEVLKNWLVFKYEDGQLIKDDAYQQQLLAKEEIINNMPATKQEIADLWYALMSGSVTNA